MWKKLGKELPNIFTKVLPLFLFISIYFIVTSIVRLQTNRHRRARRLRSVPRTLAWKQNDFSDILNRSLPNQTRGERIFNRGRSLDPIRWSLPLVFGRRKIFFYFKRKTERERDFVCKISYTLAHDVRNERYVGIESSPSKVKNSFPSGKGVHDIDLRVTSELFLRSHFSRKCLGFLPAVCHAY